jgi:hypothetical protein
MWAQKAPSGAVAGLATAAAAGWARDVLDHQARRRDHRPAALPEHSAQLGDVTAHPAQRRSTHPPAEENHGEEHDQQHQVHGDSRGRGSTVAHGAAPGFGRVFAFCRERSLRANTSASRSE